MLKYYYDKNVTVRLFGTRRHAGEKIDGRHVHLVLAVRMRHLNGGKVSEHFVGRRELAHAVLVFDNLQPNVTQAAETAHTFTERAQRHRHNGHQKCRRTESE